MKLLDGLANPALLSDKEAKLAHSYGLLTLDLKLTEFGMLVSLRDKEASTQLLALINKKIKDACDAAYLEATTWVTSSTATPRTVFGPAYNCADMASYSLIGA
jgi:hypothetical protein